METRRSFLAGVVEEFLRGNLPVLLIVVSLVAGAIALFVTPREEEPQIVVPLADIMVMYPGGGAEEVERLVSSRLERMLSQVDGVEYVYSMSRPGMAVVTVRFFVGEDREDSLIKLYNKIQQNLDKVTPGITGWVVKPIEIDDVPVVNVALHSAVYDTHQLYRVAEEVVAKLQHIPDSARITIHGGEPRVVHVYLDPERLAAYGLSTLEVMERLRIANSQMDSGRFERGNAEVLVSAGAFLRSTREVANLLIGLYEDRPIYLRDVARVVAGPAEVTAYTRLGFGPASGLQGRDGGRESEAVVTVALAKKKGSNAVWVAREVEAMLEALRGTVIPDEVHARLTRNYGETANDKVNDLVEGLVMAVITVIGLLALSMSWRAGLIVALAVPITYSLTLLCNYLMGYTINRVTLFALILALGLLVDDPIVGVENIERHLRLARLPRLKAVVFAMEEIMPSLVLSTLAIVVAFTPMFFITGMMGPYMQPMALNVPIAVVMSTVVALTITPWLSSKLLKTESTRPADELTDISRSLVYRFYDRVIGPFIDSARKSALMLSTIGLLFGLSVAMALTGFVPLKMLPFDNKNEFQILVDMEESTTLESTDAVVRDIEACLRTMPEVVDFTSTVGAPSPMDFSGLVRHYYLRQGPHMADVRVNLLHRDQREMGSHSIVLRIRNEIERLARRHGASIKLVEAPPGPPVLATLAAEVYARPYLSYEEQIAAARTVKARMAAEKGVVDLDDSVEADQPKVFLEVDKEKAGSHGIATEEIVQTLRIALAGMDVGTVHGATEQNEVPLTLRLPRAARSSIANLSTVTVKGRTGNVVQLGELGVFKQSVEDKTIYHKNQERVVYVTAEMAGRGPAYAVLALQSHFKEHPLPAGVSIDWRGEGEWKITLDVFRDLGIAFSVALLGIYVLLVYETASYLLPVIIMLSIPLTMIGIMPGFWLLNLLVNRPVGGFDNPVFFTATAMIGMIALCGIVVRNAIVLIAFIRTAIEEGKPLRQAIIESGAVRFRPIVLTAATTLLGAWPITFDPIFSGLAWALIFGLFVSTVFTMIVVPVVYKLIYGREAEAAPGRGV